jgi:membrane-bound lytic murein transglycosylase D
MEKQLALAAANKTTTTTATQTQTQTQVKTTSTQTQTQNSGQSTKPPSYTKYVYHTVQKGDSLWSIANRYKGASVDEIRRLNGLKPNSMIFPGQKLKVGVTG